MAHGKPTKLSMWRAYWQWFTINHHIANHSLAVFYYEILRVVKCICATLFPFEMVIATAEGQYLVQKMKCAAQGGTCFWGTAEEL